jgi:hypothetical protein
MSFGAGGAWGWTSLGNARRRKFIGGTLPSAAEGGTLARSAIRKA